MLQTLIRNVSIMAPDAGERGLVEADILIVGERIAQLGNNLALLPCVRTIEGRGLLAVPGLINAHVHSPGNLMRGCLNGLPLEIFMLYEVPPLASARDAQRIAYLRTALGAIEMLKLGITSVFDDAYFAPICIPEAIDSVLSAYRDSGMRATVALDQPTLVEYEKHPYLAELLPAALRRRLDEAPRQSMAELQQLYRHLISTWHGQGEGRLSAAVSCSAPQRVSIPYLQWLSETARSHDIPFACHILESRTQRVFGELKYGKSLVEYVDELGVLDEWMQVIHAIWVDGSDIDRLALSGCTVAHNPICNLRLGSGVMPWQALRAAGVPICLGTDEACVDDTHNLWLVAKIAGMIHSLSDPDYQCWPGAGDILDALWAGGARALRRTDSIGRIEVGMQADLTLLDLNSDAFTPLNDVRRQLVYCETGASVRQVFVAGRQVVEDGRLTTLDEVAIKQEIHELEPLMRASMRDLEREVAVLEPHYRAMYERAMRHEVGMNRRLV